MIKITEDLSLNIGLKQLGTLVIWVSLLYVVTDLVLKKFQRQKEIEKVVAYSEFVGTLLIIASVAKVGGISIGGIPLQAQIFSPIFGAWFITLAFWLKISLAEGYEDVSNSSK